MATSMQRAIQESTARHGARPAAAAAATAAMVHSAVPRLWRSSCNSSCVVTLVMLSWCCRRVMELCHYLLSKMRRGAVKWLTRALERIRAQCFIGMLGWLSWLSVCYCIRKSTVQWHLLLVVTIAVCSTAAPEEQAETVRGSCGCIGVVLVLSLA
jgi:ABC-type uncharacterized transport system permease subunit